jgi:hypothetical protein
MGNMCVCVHACIWHSFTINTIDNNNLLLRKRAAQLGGDICCRPAIACSPHAALLFDTEQWPTLQDKQTKFRKEQERL